MSRHSILLTQRLHPGSSRLRQYREGGAAVWKKTGKRLEKVLAARMAKQDKLFYEFGPFRLDLAERILLRDGEHIPLTPKAYETLVALVENSGRILDKEELLNRVWPDTFIEEATLAKNISTLRKVLSNGDGAREYIETIPKRGYRFVAGVRKSEGEAPALLVQERTRTRIVAEEEESLAPLPEPTAPVTQPEAARGVVERRRLLRLGVIASVMLLAGLAVVLYYSQPAKRDDGRATPGVKSLAVLPFKFTGANKEDEFLGLGMTDALITKLGYLRQVAVRPTSAVIKYEAEGQDVAAVGRELRVEAVLDGRVQKFGDRLSVRVQLVGVRDGAVLWSGEFARQSADILELQDAISRQVAQALAVSLTGEERELLTKRCTEDAAACEAYTKGRYFWNRRTPGWFEKAIESFEQAAEIDPGYSQAYAGLAETYLILGDHGVRPPKEVLPKAKAAAIKALELEGRLAEAHNTLANIHARFDWDAAAAEREFKRAIELNPGYALSYGYYAIHLSNLGRFDEAIAVMKQGLALDPLLISLHVYAAGIYEAAGRYDRAVAQARQALDLDASFGTAYRFLGRAYERKGMYEEALAAHHQAASFLGNNPSLKFDIGYTLAAAGRRPEAIKLLEELKALSAERYVRPYGIALIHLGLGENEQAIEWLYRALEDRDPFMANLVRERRLDPLRSDHRFKELVRKVGLVG
jgi:DNA-binding winged helix-turn-helix (wHTH) protein/TolB-like protein/Flp pilus assembly protein TadD